jgi:hypothetical protein
MAQLLNYIYGLENVGKCELSYDANKAYSCGANKMQLCPDYIKIPVVDDKYFDSRSIYEKCKCIDKIKSSLEILAKNEPAKYNAYFDIYKKKYTQNNCADVFKNYIATNQQDIYNTTTQADKLRIETQSIKERNQRIYIGVVFLAVAVGMVTIYQTRNS